MVKKVWFGEKCGMVTKVWFGEKCGMVTKVWFGGPLRVGRGRKHKPPPKSSQPTPQRLFLPSF